MTAVGRGPQMIVQDIKVKNKWRSRKGYDEFFVVDTQPWNLELLSLITSKAMYKNKKLKLLFASIPSPPLGVKVYVWLWVLKALLLW